MTTPGVQNNNSPNRACYEKLTARLFEALDFAVINTNGALVDDLHDDNSMRFDV